MFVDMTLTKKIAFGLNSSFSIVDCEVPKSIYVVEINFEDGRHVYTSPDIQIGTVKSPDNQPLIGRFTFCYSYDAKSRTITLCGTDYPSVDGLALATYPKNMEGFFALRTPRDFSPTTLLLGRSGTRTRSVRRALPLFSSPSREPQARL